MPGLKAPLSTPPLFDLLSLLLSCSLTRPCALLPPFPFLISSFLSCLDFLTEDCQGFQLFLSRSFPPYCTLLPHRLGRRFICAVLFVFLSCALFLLLPVKVLELPGQRRVRFFNTSSLPLCFGFALVAFCFVGLGFGVSFFTNFYFVFRY